MGVSIIYILTILLDNIWKKSRYIPIGLDVSKIQLDFVQCVLRTEFLDKQEYEKQI